MGGRALLAVVAAVAVGCSSGDPESLERLSEDERAALPVLDHEGVRELVAQHKGKVVVLAGWSAAKEGYEALYEGLAPLAKPGADTGPVVIAMNLDGAVAVRAKVLPLLRKVRPAFANCVFDGDQMMLSAVVDRDWAGLVPALWIYNPEGEVAASFYGGDALAKAKAKLAGLARRQRRRRRAVGLATGGPARSGPGLAAATPSAVIGYGRQ